MATNTTSQQQKVDSVKHNEEKIPELIDHDTGANGEINEIMWNRTLHSIP